MSDLKCGGVTYVSGGTEEYGSDGYPDWAYRVRAVCDGGPPGDCGFDVPMPEEDGETAWGLTNADMGDLHAQHLIHSRKATR